MTDVFTQRVLQIQGQLDELEKREDELLLELGRAVRDWQLEHPEATSLPRASSEESFCLLDRDGDWWTPGEHGRWYLRPSNDPGRFSGAYIKDTWEAVVETFGCSTSRRSGR